MPRARRPAPKEVAPVVGSTTSPTNIIIAPASSFTLYHPFNYDSYTFHPRGEEVLVEFRSKTTLPYCYHVPVKEARELWRELLKGGHERS